MVFVESIIICSYSLFICIDKIRKTNISDQAEFQYLLSGHGRSTGGDIKELWLFDPLHDAKKLGKFFSLT